MTNTDNILYHMALIGIGVAGAALGDIIITGMKLDFSTVKRWVFTISCSVLLINIALWLTSCRSDKPDLPKVDPVQETETLEYGVPELSDTETDTFIDASFIELVEEAIRIKNNR